MNKLAVVTLLVTLAVSAVVDGALEKDDYSFELREVIRKFRNSCLVKSDAYKEDIENLNQGHFPDDPAVKNYVACIVTSTGAISKDGVINTEVIAKLQSPHWEGKRPQVVADCYEKNKDVADFVERIYKTEECVYKYKPSIFYFP